MPTNNTNNVEPSDRKFQVFISSTFSDLADRRQQALDVIVDQGHIPVALERSEAADKSVPDVIKRAVKNCQLYILILGHRYGSLTPGKDKSFTELEYDFARDNGLTVLPFVMNPEEADAMRTKLYAEGSAAGKEEFENEAKYLSFRQRVMDADIHFCRRFSRHDKDFKFHVLKSLSKAEQECKQPGWVREPEADQLRDVLKSISRNQFIVDIVGALSGLKTLDERCAEYGDEKMAVAAAFQDVYLQKVNEKRVNLFLESGSTLAYVADKIGANLVQARSLDKHGVPRVVVSTNNVLAYLLFWLKHRIPCTLFPSGTPELTYGASLGPLHEDIYYNRDPQYPPGPLIDTELREIAKLNDAALNVQRWNKPTLLLGATSGLQLTAQYRLKGGGRISSELHQCRGPHVGSYKNKLFKRFMYQTMQPLLIFLTAEKVNCEIEYGKCHFMFDDQKSWDRFIVEHPVGFCIGCRRSQLAEIATLFEQFGFKTVIRQTAGEFTGVVTRNAKFIKEFEMANDISF